MSAYTDTEPNYQLGRTTGLVWCKDYIWTTNLTPCTSVDSDRSMVNFWPPLNKIAPGSIITPADVDRGVHPLGGEPDGDVDKGDDVDSGTGDGAHEAMVTNFMEGAVCPRCGADKEQYFKLHCDARLVSTGVVKCTWRWCRECNTLFDMVTGRWWCQKAEENWAGKFKDAG